MLCLLYRKSRRVSSLYINIDSAPSPDGFSGYFYQQTWEIISTDLYKATMVGAKLPKFFTHTCIIMIPKIDHPQKCSELRPISLVI